MNKNLLLTKVKALRFFFYILVGITILFSSGCTQTEEPTLCSDGSVPNPNCPTPPIIQVNPVGSYIGHFEKNDIVMPLSLAIANGPTADTFLGQLNINDKPKVYELNCVFFPADTNNLSCTRNIPNDVAIFNGVMTDSGYSGGLEFNMIALPLIEKGSFTLDRQ